MRKKVLLGANTAQGFVSYYDQILVPKAKFLGIIKGGPGTGKSTFMRKVAAEFEKEYQLEELRCSSDQDSLDGIVILGEGIALVDGTRPHIVDPRYPGCIDEIIYFGAFWDQEGICSQFPKIVALQEEIAARYQRIYRLLASALKLQEIQEDSYQRGLDTQGINEITKKFTTAFAELPIKKDGVARHLFAASLSPEGYLHYLESIFAGKEVYLLEDSYQLAGPVLSQVLREAQSRGLFVEAFHSPFCPEKIQHLSIAELNLGFCTVETEQTLNLDVKRVFSVDRLVSLDQVWEREQLEAYKAREEELIAWAGEELGTIKKLHEELEACYFPYMDFPATDELLTDTIGRIRSLLGEGT